MKGYYCCISVGRTGIQNLQMEIFAHFTRFQTNLQYANCPRFRTNLHIYIYKLVHVFRRIFTYPKRSESLENVQIFPAVVFVCIIYILWSPFQICIYACCKVIVSSNSACSTNRRTLALVVDTVQQQRRTLVLIHIFVQKRRLEFYLDLCPVANDPCSFLLRFPLIRGISDCSARSAICFANRHCIYTIICFFMRVTHFYYA